MRALRERNSPWTAGRVGGHPTRGVYGLPRPYLVAIQKPAACAWQAAEDVQMLWCLKKLRGLRRSLSALRQVNLLMSADSLVLLILVSLSRVSPIIAELHEPFFACFVSILRTKRP